MVRDRLKMGPLTEVDQLVYLRAVFPGVPLRLLVGACAPLLASEGVDWTSLPWNRRFRRSVSRSPQGSVLVAIEPFTSAWKGFGRVVRIADSERGLGSHLVFQLLMSWATRGLIGGVVKGEPGHPEAFGSPRESVWNLLEKVRTDEGWNCAGGDYQELVRLLRMWMIFAVAQAFEDSEAQKGCSETGLEEVLGLSTGSSEGFGRLEEGVDSGTVTVADTTCCQDPGELALWALKRAAERISEQSKREKEKLAGGVFLVFGLGKGSTRGTRKPDNPLLTPLLDAYGLHEACFDQGCFGAPGVYDTRIVTSSWFLFETLHEVRAPDEEKLYLDALRDYCPEGCGLSQCGWTGCLLKVIQSMWVKWKLELQRQGEVAERQLILKRLSQEEQHSLHIAQDHVPYRKGCPICVAAQGRQRSHWRSSCPGVHSLSVDISGPFIPGQSYDVEASGRDRGSGYKYFLAGAYSVPRKYTPERAELLSMDEYEPSECAELLPEESAAGVELESIDALFQLPDRPEGSDAVVRAVAHRVRSKRPEVADPLVEQDPEEEAPAALYRTLFLGIPLRSKKGREVMLQVQGLVNRLESAGFPVQRYHSDRAKELRSANLIGWLKSRGIHCTWTAGESPAGNRAELSVQGLKGFVRKLLLASGLGKQFWPLALIHASTRNWINFSESLGVPQPQLLPFGVSIHARRRTRSGYAAQWESRTVEGKYLGHAPSTPGGHLVLVPDGVAD